MAAEARAAAEYIDASLYPDRPPPTPPLTDAERAEHLHRVCASWDFGIVPEPRTLRTLAGWRRTADAAPIPDSPAYHALRALNGWLEVEGRACLADPPYVAMDRREGRTDPCADWI